MVRAQLYVVYNIELAIARAKSARSLGVDSSSADFSLGIYYVQCSALHAIIVLVVESQYSV
eukprot:7255-Heterococcus_DN1.PRE.1